jgi:hypothetical protein
MLEQPGLRQSVHIGSARDGIGKNPSPVGCRVFGFGRLRCAGPGIRRDARLERDRVGVPVADAGEQALSHEAAPSGNAGIVNCSFWEKIVSLQPVVNPAGRLFKTLRAWTERG